MTYEEFLEFVSSKCMHETIYEDSEGRLILVIDMLSAYDMVNKLESVEREACAKVCEETDDGTPYNLSGECAAAIRARGNTQ
jgi:hypothetical protein